MATPFENYFGLLPDQASNPVGVALRKGWATITEASLQGRYDPLPGTFPRGPYSDLFFHVSPSSLNSLHARLFTLGGGGPAWAAFASAMVTDTLLQVAPTTQVFMHPQGPSYGRGPPLGYKQRHTSEVTAPMLGQLYGAAQAGYQIVFQSIYAAQLQPTSAATYIARLTSPAWVMAKMASVASGTWTDAAWEMFHHAIKILAAGGTPAQVSAAFTTVANMGLAVPLAVNAANWPSYRGFIGSPVLATSDLIADGMPGLLTPVQKVAASPKGIYGSTIPEGVAQGFMGSSPYRWNPGGSCFAPTTRVLLADGSDRAISDMHVGDLVWTPQGAAPVRVVARVPRGGRPLLRVNGAAMSFSDSHPFVDGTTGGSLAVHPARARAFAPGIDHDGLGLLDAGAVLVQVGRGGGQSRCPVQALDHECNNDEFELVDLILEPTAAGFPSYAVGDGGQAPFHLVRSEVLRFEAHAAGTLAGIVLLGEAAPAIGAALAPLTRADVPRLVQAMREMLPWLIAQSLAEMAQTAEQADGASAAPVPPVPPLHEHLSALLAAFHAGDGEFNWRLGTLQEALAQCLVVPLDHIVRSAWRPFDSDPSAQCGLAVTVHDIVSEAHAPLLGAWTLSVALEGAPTRSIELAAPTSRHHRAAGLTVLRPAPLEQPMCPLTVTLRNAAGEEWGGIGVVPRPAHGFVSAAVALSKVGKVRGRGPDAVVRFDARALEADVLAKHADQAPAHWDEAAQMAFALRFGRAMAKHFGERLAAVLAQTAGASG